MSDQELMQLVEDAVRLFFSKNDGADRFTVTTIHGMIGRIGIQRGRILQSLVVMCGMPDPIISHMAEVMCRDCPDEIIHGGIKRPEEWLGRDVVCEDCGLEFVVAEEDLLDWFVRVGGRG